VKKFEDYRQQWQNRKPLANNWSGDFLQIPHFNAEVELKKLIAS